MAIPETKVIGIESQYAFHDVAELGEPVVDPTFEHVDAVFLVVPRGPALSFRVPAPPFLQSPACHLNEYSFPRGRRIAVSSALETYRNKKCSVII